MADFRVVFSGKLVEGADPGRVRANLAKLFKTDEARVARLFSGKSMVLKKGLDEDAARKYRAVLAKAGAVVEIMPEKGGGEPAGTAAEATRKPPAAPDLSVAEAGATLVEHRPAAAPSIDTSHLSMAEPGVTLVEHEPVPEPQFDLSGLTLDPPGTTLSEDSGTPPAEIDTSGLSLES